MSYSELKPEYYRMFQPDSPWHAGAPGWKSAPWPGWGRNPNLVGPPRLAVNGLGAYFAPKYETAISGLGRGLGSSGCGCKGASGMGDGAALAPTATEMASGENLIVYGLLAGLALGGILFFAKAKS